MTAVTLVGDHGRRLVVEVRGDKVMLEVKPAAHSGDVGASCQLPLADLERALVYLREQNGDVR